MSNQELFFQKINSILFILVLYLFFKLIFDIFGAGMDSSDTSNFNRSGMEVHIDAKTGVNYLSYGNVLVPRLNPDGSIHVGVEE